MQLGKNQILPIIIVVLVVVVSVTFRPLLVIDETRYFGVAWEMFQNKNFLVPHLNGLPYDHKPPLLFWLINLDWFFFGVNETSARFIPALFAIGSMVLVWRIYVMLWSKDSFGQTAVLWVMAGMVVFSFYATLFMFDIMLGFWVLLAIYGGLRALREPTVKNFAIIALAVGFGTLAKSPVIVAHLLPLYLFAHLFAKPTKRFYIGGAVAVFAGLAIFLLWALPAASMGGEKFAYGILWEQYAGRAVNSFAHKRPFWWYLYWVPLFVAPWLLTRPFWQGLKHLQASRAFDSGMRFVIVWLLGSLLIFSFISGKQVHYIVPELGGFALLITRLISLAKVKKIRPLGAGVLFVLLGIALIVAPSFIKGFMVVYLDRVAFFVSGALLAFFGLYLVTKKFESKLSFVSHLAWGAALFIFVVHYILHIYFNTQDFSQFAQKIKVLQEQGRNVVHYGKYNDQYQFIGRLKSPLKVVRDAKELQEYIKSHPDDYVITYLQRYTKYDKSVVIDHAKLRTQNILLIRAKDYNRLFQ